MELQELIRNADRVKNKDNIKKTSKKLLIPRFKELGFKDPYVVIEKPTIDILALSLEKQEKYFQLSECMVNPNLADTDVQKAFKVNNKVALLKKIFTEEELGDLVLHLGKLTSHQSKAIEVDIKN